MSTSSLREQRAKHELEFKTEQREDWASKSSRSKPSYSSNYAVKSKSAVNSRNYVTKEKAPARKVSKKMMSSDDKDEGGFDAEESEEDDVTDESIQFWESCSAGKLADVTAHVADPKVDVNVALGPRDDPPLTAAVRAGHVAVVLELLKESKVELNKTNSGGATAFYIACQEGRLDLVQSMLPNEKIDVNHGDVEGGTPLILALLNSHFAVMEELLASPRILVNQGDQAQATPLFYAASMNSIKTVKRLLTCKEIDINKARLTGQTPLQVACVQGHVDVVATLLKCTDIDPNQAVTLDGMTPLHGAAASGHVHVVQLLLRDPRVQVNLKNKAGATALAKAMEWGRKNIIEWMLVSNREIDLTEEASVPSKASEEREGPKNRARDAVGVEALELMKRAREDLEKTRQEIKLALDPFKLESVLRTTFDPPLPITFPASFSNPSEIAHLNLSNLKLKELPETLGQFTGLTKLDLAFNSLTALPAVVAKLPQLVSLDLTGLNLNKEQIDSVSHILVNMGQLQQVDFDGNETPMPSELANKLTENIKTHDTLIETIRKDLEIPVPPLLKLFFRPLLFTSVADITVLRLNNCGLPTLTPAFNKLHNLVELDISSNPFTNQDFASVLAEILKANKKLERVNLVKTKLQDTGAALIFQALVYRFAQEFLTLTTFEIDDLELRSFDGLGIIPIDILRQGTKVIAQFMLDLFRAPGGSPLYRSKLMVVGFESVGKTTVINCLFPLTGWLQYKGTLFSHRYWFTLQGNRLIGYEGENSPNPVVKRTFYLEDRKWEITTPSPVTIKLLPKSGAKSFDGKSKARSFRLQAETQETRDIWLARLKYVCMNEATHGIEIRSLSLNTGVVKEVLGGEQSLELSIWDFAGQHDYYHSHHYFLSTRTMFLVLWKMSDGEKGLKSLDFWFRSIAAHLPRTIEETDDEGNPLPGQAVTNTRLYSICVVGTFLDHESVAPDAKSSRQAKVEAMASDCGIQVTVQYHEVSCSTLQNVGELHDALLRETLTHSYMGERVPKSYLGVARAMEHLAPTVAALPVVGLDEIIASAKSELLFEKDTVQRALQLLHLWGQCVYFDNPPELASTAILDPRFLTKDVMSQLFNPRLVSHYKDGIFSNADLIHIWTAFKLRPDFWELAATLMLLMEKFEVCFTLSSREEGAAEVPFKERKSIFPAFLPETPPSELVDWWSPTVPPSIIHLEKFVQFNAAPKEMIGRLFVRLHSRVEERLFWRHGMYFDKGHHKALVTVDLPSNRITLAARGTNRADCMVFMETLTQMILEISRLYSGISFRQMVSSPFSPETPLLLDEVLADYSKEPKQRMLKCPKTRTVIDSEKVLLDSGMIGNEAPPVSQDKSWWAHQVNSTWSQMGEVNKFSRLEIVRDGEAKDQDLAEKLHSILGDKPRVRVAYAIDNPLLRSGFDVFLKTLEGKIRAKEKLFKKDDWKALPDAARRASFLDVLSEYSKSFPWNTAEGKLSVIPMIQGTSIDAAWSICENGFATVATLDDGYYGKGIYFTEDYDYAKNYSRECDEGKVFIVGMVIPGNPFPLTEPPFFTDASGNPMVNAGTSQREIDPKGYYGKPLRGGYQSHYTMVPKGRANPLPIQVEYDAKEHASELVLFQDAQTLPIFVVFCEAE